MTTTTTRYEVDATPRDYTWDLDDVVEFHLGRGDRVHVHDSYGVNPGMLVMVRDGRWVLVSQAGMQHVNVALVTEDDGQLWALGAMLTDVLDLDDMLTWLR